MRSIGATSGGSCKFHGDWIEKDGTKRSGDLWTWGEWEPESRRIREFNAKNGGPYHPRYLWEPYWIRKNSYQGLHNTDPFIFGERFLYSNCRQTSQNSAWLRSVAQGSVIAFGSGKTIKGERRWILDTVLVVKDFVDYEIRKAHMELRDWAPNTFLHVTGGPLSNNDGEASHSGTCARPAPRLRLYRGATFDDPVDKMFSFFPARSADGDSGFQRPTIDLPSKHFNPCNWQAPKGAKHDLSADDLHDLWKSLVTQVRNNRLVLGTWAELPPRRA